MLKQKETAETLEAGKEVLLHGNPMSITNPDSPEGCRRFMRRYGEFLAIQQADQPACEGYPETRVAGCLLGEETRRAARGYR